MNKIVKLFGVAFGLGLLLTLGACGWGPWHGHHRGWNGAGPQYGTTDSYWHGPQYGNNHYDGCGHSRYGGR